MQRPQVFISFASPESGPAAALASAFEEGGVPAFFAPRDIGGGANFALEIVKAISASDVVVVLLSPSAISSPHVRREVSLAIDERRSLLPLAMPGTTYPVGFTREWTYWLSAVQVTDFPGPAASVDLVRQLLHGRDAESRNRTPAAPVTVRDPDERPPGRRPIRKRGSPSSLLTAERDVVPLAGREVELTRLEQWCYRDDDFDARLLVAGAGEGKTRLAREFARRVEAAGWGVTFFAADSTGRGVVKGFADQAQLVVVDYAETRAEQVGRFLDELLDLGIHDPVRLLLIARGATDWWKQLAAQSADISDLLADATVQRLTPLTNDRGFVEQLYASAFKNFAVALGADPSDGRAIAPYREYGSVLEVLEDALTGVLGDAGERGGNRLLAHERRYIAAAAQVDGLVELDATDINRIASVLSLFGAQTEEEAVELVSWCNLDLTASMQRKVARLFRRLYPASSGYSDGLKPDALAEDLLAEILEEEGAVPGLQAPRALDDAALERRRRALTLLTRASVRHRRVAADLAALIQRGNEPTIVAAMEVATQVEDPTPLTAVLAEVLESREDLDALALLGGVPDETVALADIAAILSRRAIAALPEPSDMGVAEVDLAMSCSNRFSDAGWPAEAVDAAEIAVSRLAVLVTDCRVSPAALGKALTNLSNRLWELGRLDEALAPAQRAVGELERAEVEGYELAAARNNLAFRLAEVGRAEEALGQATEAERLCRVAAEDAVTIDVRTFGSTLNNLTCFHVAIGRTDEAVRVGLQAVALRRSQALSNRDRFLPYVARALANASVAAAAAGDDDTADRLVDEARALHSITGPRAPIFRFEQAESAFLQAVILLDRGRGTEAVAAADEAGSLLRSIEIDLGELGVRLAGSIAALVALAVLTEPARRRILPLPAADRPLHVPQLLEYRDL